MSTTWQILLPIISSLITGVLAYLAAVQKSKSDLRAVELTNENKLKEIEAQAKADMEKLEKQLDKQAEYDEKVMKNQVVGSLVGEMFKGKTPGQLKELQRQFEKL